MAHGTENITVEKVWDDAEPFTVYKLPSGYKGKVLMVYENLHDVSVRVVTEQEYQGCVRNLLYAERPETDEEQSDDKDS